MTNLSHTTIYVFLVSSSILGAQSKGFLRAPAGPALRPSHKHTLSELENSLRDAQLIAMTDGSAGVAGMGHHALREIENDIRATFLSLPKNVSDHVGVKGLRYLIHRYFMGKAGLVLPGIEPKREATAQGSELAKLIESLDESQHHGSYKLGEVAMVIATLEQLLFSSDGEIVASARSQLAGSDADLQEVLEAFFAMRILNSDDAYSRHQISSMYGVHWRHAKEYISGLVQAETHEQQRQWKAMSPKENEETAQKVAAKLRTGYMDFVHDDCMDVKRQLVDADPNNEGRVGLKDFYRMGLTNGRFAESQDYLRQLGALDESSWRGAKVIIPNYIQAASNCHVAADDYLLCCKNECESIHDDFEAAIAAPTASPREIMTLVQNMSFASENDLSERRIKNLDKQLLKLADMHGGQVPLHGRLFAQWLHTAFPRECPFPHQRGKVSMKTPTEFGHSSGVLSYSQMREESQKAAEQTPEDASVEQDEEAELDWEEELLAGDHATPGRKSSRLGLVLFASALLAGFAYWLANTGILAKLQETGRSFELPSSSGCHRPMAFAPKQHLV